MKDGKASKLSQIHYIIDTNVILNNCNFENGLSGVIVIPDVVLKELDKYKHNFSSTAVNARSFARKLDSNLDSYEIAKTNDAIKENDLKILDIAVNLMQAGVQVVVMTNDIYMSVIARSLDLSVQKQAESTDELYTGISDELIFPNQYQITRAGIYKLKNGKKKRIGKDAEVSGITHKNAEQRCLIDALTDDSIQLVTVVGAAGTGKTLLSIASGLQKVLNEELYDRLVVARPIIPMGNEIGFLPGEMNEKLLPWMQPIFDNIDFLFKKETRQKKTQYWEELERQGVLKIEALAYIRGRTMPNEFIVIDEAQNLSPHEIKTIITRAGHGSKIIITGDIKQIDNPKLDMYNNGLTYVIEKLKDEEIAAHITLTKCERSELAKIASEKL